MKRLVLAPLSNTIYYATVNEKSHTMKPNTRIDITDNAVACVFEWFMNQMEGKEEFSICYPSTGFELVMRRKDATNHPTVDSILAVNELKKNALLELIERFKDTYKYCSLAHKPDFEQILSTLYSIVYQMEGENK